MANVYPEQKQYDHENESQQATMDEIAVPEAVSVYERPEHNRFSPIAVTIFAILLLVVLAASVLLFLV